MMGNWQTWWWACVCFVLLCVCVCVKDWCWIGDDGNFPCLRKGKFE